VSVGQRRDGGPCRRQRAMALAVLAALVAGALPAAAQERGRRRAPAPPPAPALPAAPPGPIGPLAELPPQTLGPGQCALFLWERAPSARRLAMLSAAPPFARVMTADGPRDLAQTEGAGEPRFGLTPEAAYADATLRLRVDLRFEDAQGLVGGALARDGALAVEGPDGETVVIPVAGILGCR
jgi:hypothetical protein